MGCVKEDDPTGPLLRKDDDLATLDHSFFFFMCLL